MRLDSEGFEVVVPPGWEVRVRHQTENLDGGASAPVLHAATFILPEERGDYGSGCVEIMGPEDVFVSLLEFGDEAVHSALFPPGEMPRSIDPQAFRTNGMQRWMPGQSAYQKFFTEGDRAYCLYVVIGDHSRRVALARTVRSLLLSIRLRPVAPPGAM
jgi:hypothetical protein